MSTDTHDKSGHHITPLNIYLGIGLTLLVLTAVTITVSFVDLGGWNVVVALIIASIKGSLVALFFMHLLYDKKIYSIVFSMGLLFLSIFIALTMFDTLRRGDIDIIKSEPINKEASIYENMPVPDTTAEHNTDGH
ncbi:MAG: cytochrome C oxidase subunit IV family protein [candidate division Zixibacteria bacterium]